ncbi:MAG: choice-of-anchor D domain-containing protein, partial [Verrucomicrobiae bacterium]|nr:choice-of-anchor D domain-containing protein [Verrucomicrobiae bacterium]
WRAVASSADGERLMAAEFGGRIYVSTDSGATWKAREFDRDWNSVSMSADGLTLGATVHFGQIYLSTDGGETWRVREAGTDRFWTALAISADGARMAAAEYEGSLYFSEATPAPHRVTVHAGAGAFTRAGFATEILAGPPDEVAAPQAVSFQVTAADESLFDELPAIDAAGALTFTPGDRAGQTAVTVVARDDGGIEDGGIDRSAPKTFTVVVLAGPEIEVSGNGEEIPSGAAAPAEANGTDFGDVLEPGDTTVSQTFVIRNTGGDPLSITDLVLEATHAMEFSLKGFDLAVLPVVLGPGEETTFTIDFDPAGPGERVATVRIDSDDADEYPYTFALRGNGVPPGVRATPHAFAENNAPGATVARLDTIGAGSATGFAYTLEAGDGDTDNARFTVAGDELRLAESADFEAKASYSVRVRAADGMRELENPVRLVVTNANEPPRFTPGDDVGVGGGVTAPQTVANWATGIDDGDSTA